MFQITLAIFYYIAPSFNVTFYGISYDRSKLSSKGNCLYTFVHASENRLGKILLFGLLLEKAQCIFWEKSEAKKGDFFGKILLE